VAFAIACLTCHPRLVAAPIFTLFLFLRVKCRRQSRAYAPFLDLPDRFSPFFFVHWWSSMRELSHLFESRSAQFCGSDFVEVFSFPAAFMLSCFKLTRVQISIFRQDHVHTPLSFAAACLFIPGIGSAFNILHLFPPAFLMTNFRPFLSVRFHPKNIFPFPPRHLKFPGVPRCPITSQSSLLNVYRHPPLRPGLPLP